MNKQLDDVYLFNKQINNEVLLDALLSRLAKIEAITILITGNDVEEYDIKYLVNCCWIINGLAEELIEIGKEIQTRYSKNIVGSL